MAYINVTEIAKLIRKDLKNNFPNTKFSVRCSGSNTHSAIDIRFLVSDLDGVREPAVKSLVCKYEIISRDYATGEVLGGGNRFIFVDEKIPPHFVAYAEAMIRLYYMGMENADKNDYDFNRLIRLYLCDKDFRDRMNGCRDRDPNGAERLLRLCQAEPIKAGVQPC